MFIYFSTCHVLTERPDLTNIRNGSTVMAMPGENVTLSISVGGNPIPSITPSLTTWYRLGNATPIVSSGRIILGADGLSVAFMPARTSDSGTYIVQINHPTGEFTIQISLNVRLVIVLELVQVGNQNVTVDAAGQVSFECIATGLPLPTIVWLKDGNLFPILSQRVVLSATNGSTNVTSILSISELVSTDEGKYTCKAVQEGTFDALPFYLSINKPDPCASNPCDNGGTCVTDFTSYVCKCPKDFTGLTCSIRKTAVVLLLLLWW